MVREKINIAVGSDHGGYLLKEKLKGYFLEKRYSVKDFGVNSPSPSDYPLVGYKVAKAVSAGKSNFGIAICKTGFGMAIIANKLKNVRSAVCDTPSEAKSARAHNDCNFLSLSAKRTAFKKAKKIVDMFLITKAEGGRHARRVGQIKRLEK